MPWMRAVSCDPPVTEALPKTRKTVFEPRHAGSVLVLTVWILLVLSVLALAVGAGVSANIETARFLRDSSIAYYAARAGVESAEAWAGSANESVDPGATGAGRLYRDVKVGDGVFDVFHLEPGAEGKVATNSGVADEEGKVNLNFATNEVGRQAIRSLLETAGNIDFETADGIAACVADWVDTNDIPMPNGAESADYEKRVRAYSCHNGPMDDIQELMLVKGMNRALFRKAVPYLTVCGTDGRINLNTAGPVVLMGLAGARTGSDPAVCEALVERIMDFRRRGNVFANTDKREIKSLLFDHETLSAEEQAEWSILEWLLNHRMATVQSRYFCGISMGTLPRGSVAGRSILFVYDRQKDEIRAWDEY